jgi:hypothetical protein
MGLLEQSMCGRISGQLERDANELEIEFLLT